MYLTNNNGSNSDSNEPKTKSHAKAKYFNFDELEMLVCDHSDETDGKESALITKVDNAIVISIYNFKKCSIKVFNIAQPDEAYAALEEEYLTASEKDSDDTHTSKWKAMLKAFEPYSIVDDVFTVS